MISESFHITDESDKNVSWLIPRFLTWPHGDILIFYQSASDNQIEADLYCCNFGFYLRIFDFVTNARTQPFSNID